MGLLTMADLDLNDSLAAGLTLGEMGMLYTMSLVMALLTCKDTSPGSRHKVGNIYHYVLLTIYSPAHQQWSRRPGIAASAAHGRVGCVPGEGRESGLLPVLGLCRQPGLKPR